VTRRSRPETRGCGSGPDGEYSFEGRETDEVQVLGRLAEHRQLQGRLAGEADQGGAHALAGAECCQCSASRRPTGGTGRWALNTCSMLFGDADWCRSGTDAASQFSLIILGLTSPRKAV